jgi:hypothetical protein
MRIALSQIVVVALGLGVYYSPLAAAEGKVINPKTLTYDYYVATTDGLDGEFWHAWHGYREGQDQVLARNANAEGLPSTLHRLSEEGATHGPPAISVNGQGQVVVVWATKIKGRWQVVRRSLQDGKWLATQSISDLGEDSIQPTVLSMADGRFVVAWSSCRDRQWRIRGCYLTADKASLTADFSPASGGAAFRPALVEHAGEVWAFWDRYQRPNYAVVGRVIAPRLGEVERVSPAEEYCLTPTALSHDSGLHVAWLRKADVIGGPGVVSQWHTLHAAVRRASDWQQLVTSDGRTVAAELTHGLMAKIDPSPVPTGGYLGSRVRPMLLADENRVWLLWERKVDHRGSTPKVTGELIGRPSANGMWETPVVITAGHVDYRLASSQAANGELKVTASRLPAKGLRIYETQTVNLREARGFTQDQWTGWRPVDLTLQAEPSPRQTISVGEKTYHLFWADLHCHNGLTADAEGEPDEMHFYARDRAGLDVVAFTNNDFYNVPLTQYEFELGHLLANRFTQFAGNGARLDGSRPDGTRPFLSLPGFEWTSRIPGVASASLSDSGNWLPPYRNRSFPNHRSVIYPPTGGPLVHFTEVGNDIERLNAAVEKAGGITLSQHNAFKLSAHSVEVGMELTSGWSNYISSRPQLFHKPLSGGARLGFTANGDTHRRAPGLSGALTGIFAEELKPAAILESLRERRCFATMGSKIFLDSRANEAMMGQDVVADNQTVELRLRAVAPRMITRAELVRDGEVVHTAVGNGTTELTVAFFDEQLSRGEHWYYWRVTQAKAAPVLPGNLMAAQGHLAWSSPHWVMVE